jgi:hypothetical protein
MPQRMQQVLTSICSRCGHAWQSRRGKPLRCARCKSPYWDRAAAGRKTRWIVRPPDPRAAARGGLQVSVEQACDILRTWQANRSWVAMVIEDNLALVNCGGFLRAVGLDRLELSDGEENTVRLALTLQPKASYQYRVGEEDSPTQPYETLEIRFDQCLAYLGAFRAQPKEPAWLML